MSHKASKAIRRFCLDCQGGHVPSVRTCADAACVLYPLRHGDEAEEERERTATCEGAAASGGGAPARPEAGRPVRRIRLYCLGCAGSRQDVRACDAGQDCALWSFRFGVSPATFKRVVVRRQRWRTELTLPGLPR